MEEKWQRITFMPGTGIGPDGARVTGSKEHIALSRRAGAEGMVLLKNDKNFFPLTGGKKIAVFGKAQADYVKGGGGSGDTTVAYVRSILEGLQIKEAEGKIELFKPLSDYYSAYVRDCYAAGTRPGYAVEPEAPFVKEAREFTDTALITICRFSSEGWDRTGEPFDGDFYLSREEQAMVEAVYKEFPNIGVVLNIGGMMDTTWFKDTLAINGALLAWQAGMEGGLATADVICGDVNPSGHLTDTFAVNFDAYPSSESFAVSEDYVEYNDDIYVGYRYFETIPGAAEKVAYPFGYGLSYTTFDLSAVQARMETDGCFCVSAKVSNTGSCAGRQVLQVYCAQPQGKLGKPSKVLVGFAKTRLLKPGESQYLDIRFDRYAFASYDDTGLIRKSAYVLEEGDYTFLAGFNVRELAAADWKYHLDGSVVLEQLSEKCTPTRLSKRMRSDGSYEELPVSDKYIRPDDDLSLLPYDGQGPLEYAEPLRKNIWVDPEDSFLDVRDGKLSLDDFMKRLSDKEKIHLLGGQPNRGVANTLGFGNLIRECIPNVMTADGPQGLRIWKKCGVNTTAFPCGTLMACTWDTDLMYEVERAAALEVHENGIGVWLAPAINIHRTPRCGRNFEYYSEDPLVAGKIAAAAVRGIQSIGVACSLKHFCCNNKETNRRESDSILSERALREIYIKAFEICVKEADPWTIMSSYNIINGVRASENRDLLTDILRGEWGFNGVVTTDWYTHGEQYREINAGNDIKMGCGMPEETYKRLGSGELDRAALDTSVRRLLELFLKLA